MSHVFGWQYFFVVKILVFRKKNHWQLYFLFSFFFIFSLFFFLKTEYVFECNYQISRVGYYCLFVQLGKHHIRGSPFFDLKGMPGGTHAKSSVAYGPGLVCAHPNTTNTFTIGTFKIEKLKCSNCVTIIAVIIVVVIFFTWFLF